MEIHIEGLDSVRDMLNERAEQIVENIAKGVAEAGELVKGAAKDLAPVKSGALRDSITSVADGNTSIVGTNIEYGIYVEFGTGSKGDPSVPHTSKEKWTYCSDGQFYTTSGQPPQPYLVPALKNNEDKIIETIKNAVMK